MDGQRFDEFAKTLAIAPRSRRVVLGLVAGGALVALLGPRDQEAAASHRRGKKAKTCRRGRDCPSGARCAKGRCRCRAGREDCAGDGSCTDVRRDPFNCGRCGEICRIINGSCCGGACVVLSANRDNCGACGTACPSHHVCERSRCCSPHGGYCGHDDHCCSGVCDLHERECRCPAGQVATGDRCRPANPGELPVDARCNPDNPSQCASGICGCNGDDFCHCRVSPCVAPGDDCRSVGNSGCCQGVCWASTLTCST